MEQMEGQSRTHALLETVRKLLELQHEEEEFSAKAKGALCQESTECAQDSPCSDATPAAEEVIVAVPSSRKRSVQRPGVPGGPCANCGTHESPQWRRPSTKKIVLCNACGIYFSRHNTLPHRSSNNSCSAKKKTSLAAPAPGPHLQAAQGLHSSMDMGNESAGGEDEAITAAGPTHHMALLQQAACAAAAANEGPYTRRPSSHSNTSQTDIVNMSQSSRRSSPSRSSQEDEVMLDDPPPATTKLEDAYAHSQSSTQQPVLVPAVPSRKRSLRAGSTSAPATTPTAGAVDPTFAVPHAPPHPAPAPAYAAHPRAWVHPSQLLLLQQQQQLLHMRLLGAGAFPPPPPNPDLLRVLSSMQPHPQLMALQRSDLLPSLHQHMQQHQHALVLHHVHQMQQQQLHALTGLAHTSSVYTPHGAGLLGRGSVGLARSSGGAGLSTPLAQQPPAHSRSASHEGPIGASAVPPAGSQQQQLHRPTATNPPSLPVLPLAEHSSASPPLQQQQQGGAGVHGGVVAEGQAAGASHWLSPSSQQLLQQHQHQHSEEEEEEEEENAMARQRLLEPAAKRHHRQGSMGSSPEGGTHMMSAGGQHGHALKMIPSYACRGPRAVSFDATSSVTVPQQQQRLQQQLLLQQQLAALAPPLAAGGGNSSGTTLPTLYRPASCALSDC